MKDLAHNLGISLVSAYLHCRRHKYPPVQSIHQTQGRGYKNPIYQRMWEEFITAKNKPIEIADLSAKHGVPRALISSRFVDMIDREWSIPHQRQDPDPNKLHNKYPRPPSPRFLKVIRALEQTPELFDDAPQLARITKISEEQVTQYLQDYLQHMQKATTEQPKRSTNTNGRKTR